MPGALLLSVPIPTHHQLLLRQVRQETHGIKTLNVDTRMLDTLSWFVHIISYFDG
jgi:hypothetical protein